MQEQVTPQALAERIEASLAERFGESCAVDPTLKGLSELARIAGHCVHRRFLPRAVEPALLRLLCACALSAPSKSDLQQGDILVVRDKAKQRAVAALIPDMPWIAQAPVFLVFLANGSRLPQIARLRGKPFPNDHLDLFFNAVVDSALVLATFMRAAAAVGPRLLPDQRDPRPRRRRERAARAPRARRPGRRAVRRVGRPSPAASRRGSGSRSPCTRTAIEQASSRARSTPMTDAASGSDPTRGSAPPSAGARPPSTAGPRTRRGNTPSRCAPTSAPSCGPRAFGWTERGARMWSYEMV